MPSPLASLRILAAVVLIALPLRLFAAPLPKLAAPPEGERWFSINLGDERVGFGRLVVTRTVDGYRIDSQGSVKMRVMGFSREASTKESYLVGPDLALRSFTAENRIDGSPLALKGEVTPKGIRIVIESGGDKKERTLKSKGPVYPQHALNLYPLMQGAVPGKSHRLAVLDLDAMKVKQIKVEVIGRETLESGISSLHLRNNLFPMVDNDIWVDQEGNVLKESVRDDLVVTLAQDQETAKAELAEAVLCKKDLVRDFSMVRVTPPIDRPNELKGLSLELAGIPAELPILQGERQQGTRLAERTVRYTMPNPSFAPAAEVAPTTSDLEPARRIPSDHPELRVKMEEIAGAKKDPAQVARLLTDWVAREIQGSDTLGQSPLETLESRIGNCQSHARLYTALARAAGIPTRFVSGLVYRGEGFLYHSWAESYLNNRWVAIDPAFGEIPADVSHIKLVEGDSHDEMGLLAGMIGRVRAKVVEAKY